MLGRSQASPIFRAANTVLTHAALFVQMGASLPKGGPAGLFLGFVIYGTFMLAVNQCFGERVPLPRAPL